MNFGKTMCLCNYNANQFIEHVHHPQNSYFPLPIPQVINDQILIIIIVFACFRINFMLMKS